MATEISNAALTKDLLDVLSKHGVEGLPKAVTAAETVRPETGIGNKAASEYITSIVKGIPGEAFDESVLAQVANVLTKGTKQGG